MQCRNIHTGKFQWITVIRDTFCNLGFTQIWENIGLLTDNFPTLKFRSKIRKYFLEQWKEDMRVNSGADKKLRTYTNFKKEFKRELYLLAIKDRYIRKNITRFRISAHNLKIETGRHRRPQKNTYRRKNL